MAIRCVVHGRLAHTSVKVQCVLTYCDVTASEIRATVLVAIRDFGENNTRGLRGSSDTSQNGTQALKICHCVAHFYSTLPVILL
jgi:hypothetical protein